jgi:hypothetical protein
MHNSEQARDAEQRHCANHDGSHALNARNAKLASPRSRIKTPKLRSLPLPPP